MSQTLKRNPSYHTFTKLGSFPYKAFYKKPCCKVTTSRNQPLFWRLGVKLQHSSTASTRLNSITFVECFSVNVYSEQLRIFFWIGGKTFQFRNDLLWSRLGGEHPKTAPKNQMQFWSRITLVIVMQRLSLFLICCLIFVSFFAISGATQ